jgi:hypothetical protein
MLRSAALSASALEKRASVRVSLPAFSMKIWLGPLIMISETLGSSRKGRTGARNDSSVSS